MSKVKTLYKFTLIVILGIALGALAFSGALFWRGEYSEGLLDLHRLSGAILLGVALLHTLAKWRKLRRLARESGAILRAQSLAPCGVEKVEILLKGESIKRLAKRLEIEPRELVEWLEKIEK